MSDRKFLPYPWEQLRLLSRRDAAFESWCARWLGATGVRGSATRTLLAAVGEVAIAFDGVLGGAAIVGGGDGGAATLIFGRERDTDVGAPTGVRAPDAVTAASKPHIDVGNAASSGSSSPGSPGSPGAPRSPGSSGSSGSPVSSGASPISPPSPAMGSAPRGPAESTFAASPQGQRKVAPPIAAPVPARGGGARRVPSTPPVNVDPRGATFADPALLAITEASASGAPMIDEDAAYAELRVEGARIPVVGGGLMVRGIAQKLLGGPAELAAPRRLVPVEHAIFALVIASLLEDIGAPGEVVPRTAAELASAIDVVGSRAIGLRIGLGAELELGITAFVPRALALRMPPPRRAPAWSREVKLALPLVLGRCALPHDAIARLAPRDIVTIEAIHEPLLPPDARPSSSTRARDALACARYVAMVLPDGGEVVLEVVGALAVVPVGRAFVPPPMADAKPAANATARVASGYRVRDMALPDDAHAELTVTIGTTRLSLAALTELAAGQILPLARPLAGPFDLLVAGQRVGTGELVDVEGELGVRVLTVG